MSLFYNLLLKSFKKVSFIKFCSDLFLLWNSDPVLISNERERSLQIFKFFIFLCFFLKLFLLEVVQDFWDLRKKLVSRFDRTEVCKSFKKESEFLLKVLVFFLSRVKVDYGSWLELLLTMVPSLTPFESSQGCLFWG